MSEELLMRRVRDLANSDVVALIAKSDQYMSALYPPESNHAEPLAALIGDDSVFFAGYIGVKARFTLSGRWPQPGKRARNNQPIDQCIEQVLGSR